MPHEPTDPSRYRRKVVFVGNCQAQGLAAVYERRVAPLLGEQVVFVEARPHQDAMLLAQLEHADVIAEQKFDGPDPVPAAFVPRPGVRRVRFPYVSGRFYWPFGGATHANPHAQAPDVPRPYDQEIGDSLLNKMIVAELPPDEALRQYDVEVAASAARITRMLDLHLDRQRARDDACGLHFVDFIAANFRRERLFTTQGHPGPTLSRLLAASVFEALGVPYPVVEQAVSAMHAPPFPATELPLHHGVATVLGLTCIAPDQRYRLRDEGYVTFAEFVARYMAYAWVPEMREAINLFRDDEVLASVPVMRAALRQCPGSAKAWRVFAMGLRATGEIAEAEAAIRHALLLAPPEQETLTAAALILIDRGDLDAAAEQARKAVALFPGLASGAQVMADILARQGRMEAAVAVARVASAWEPYDVGALWGLAHLLRTAGRPEESEPVLREALRLDPTNVHILSTLEAFRPQRSAAPTPRPFRVMTLGELSADPEMRIDGQPVAQRLDNLPPHAVAVPPLGFGEIAAADADSYEQAHPAAPAWLLRNVMVHGPYGRIHTDRHVIAETLEAGQMPDTDGALLLPSPRPAGNVHTGFHLLGNTPDDYARWLPDLAGRFSMAMLTTLLTQPGASRGPIALHPPLDQFWKWESLELILPETLAKIAVDPEGALFVQRLLYVPPLAGPDFLTHPTMTLLFDAMRERVVGDFRRAPGGGRRLFLCGSAGAPANEAELLALASVAGFERMEREATPFPVQVRLFAEASHVIATHGADLAGVAFCFPDAAVCELRRDAGAPLVFRHLAALRGLRYGRLTGIPADDAWRIEPEALAALLADPRFAYD